MRCSAFIVKPLFSFATAALKAADASEEQDYSKPAPRPQARALTENDCTNGIEVRRLLSLLV